MPGNPLLIALLVATGVIFEDEVTGSAVAPAHNVTVNPVQTFFNDPEPAL